MNHKSDGGRSLALAITKSASKQTYYTIRFFVDRQRRDDAYRAYAYFRWLDDILDSEAGSKAKKIAFANRQQSLMEACYRGEIHADLCPEEWLLADLVRHDTDINSGLRSYLHNMMEVMTFDVDRRGQFITQAELLEYSRLLATAVTEAIFYFIAHDDPPPPHENRYLAVTAAHITHMLRDAYEDAQAGYFNIPVEYLRRREITPQAVESRAYREWVCGRVKLARRYFRAGREYLARIKSLRCRLAASAYMARFEWMLRLIERDNYCLRCDYPERKSLQAGLWMGWSTLASMYRLPRLTSRRGSVGNTGGLD